MQAKKPESEDRITARTLAHMATCAVSYEEFGRRVFRQLLLQAAHQLEQGSVTELSTENSVTFGVDCRATVGLVRPPSSVVGIGVGLAVEFALGEVVYLEDATDLSLWEPWWRRMERVD